MLMGLQRIRCIQKLWLRSHLSARLLNFAGVSLAYDCSIV